MTLTFSLISTPDTPHKMCSLSDLNLSSRIVRASLGSLSDLQNAASDAMQDRSGDGGERNSRRGSIMDLLGLGTTKSAEMADTAAAAAAALGRPGPPPPTNVGGNNARADTAVNNGERALPRTGSVDSEAKQQKQAQRESEDGNEERSNLSQAAQASKMQNYSPDGKIQPGDMVVAMHNFAGDDEGELPMKKGQKVSERNISSIFPMLLTEEEPSDKSIHPHDFYLACVFARKDSCPLHGRRGLVAGGERWQNGTLPLKLRQSTSERRIVKLRMICLRT